MSLTEEILRQKWIVSYDDVPAIHDPNQDASHSLCENPRSGWPLTLTENHAQARKTATSNDDFLHFDN